MRIQHRRPLEVLHLILWLSLGFGGIARGSEGAVSPALLDSLVCEAQLASDPTLESMKELRVGTYNVENMTDKNFALAGHEQEKAYGAQFMYKKTKKEWAMQEIASIILEAKLDIVSLQEVYGKEALDKLNEYLGNTYDVYYAGGNDVRGYNVGFLVKKGLPFQIQYESHKDMPFPGRENDPEKVFARDCPTVYVRAKDQPADSKPLLVVFGNHSKSKRPEEGDPDGSLRRTAQAQASAILVQRLQQKYGFDLPVILAGDFNNHVDAQPEYLSLWRSAHLEDAFNVLPEVPPFKDRISHTFHGDTPLPPVMADRMHRPSLRVAMSQLDAIMISPSLQSMLMDAQVYRYKDENGDEKPLPHFIVERKRNPSDHFMMYATFDFQKIRAQQAKPDQPITPEAQSGN